MLILLPDDQPSLNQLINHCFMTIKAICSPLFSMICLDSDHHCFTTIYPDCHHEASIDYPPSIINHYRINPCWGPLLGSPRGPLLGSPGRAPPIFPAHRHLQRRSAAYRSAAVDRGCRGRRAERRTGPAVSATVNAAKRRTRTADELMVNLDAWLFS